MKTDIFNIIKDLKENNQIECKLSKDKFPKETLKTYSSFANTNGGVIILGVEEKDGKFDIFGIQNPDKIKKEIFNILNNREKISKNLIVDKNISEKVIDGKNIILIEVPRANYKDKPIFIGTNPMTGTYKRNFEGDYKCSESEVKAMIRDSSEESMDNILLEGFNIDDLDESTLNDYRSRFSTLKPNHPFISMTNEEFFRKISVLRKNRNSGKLEPTLAGILVFGKMEAIKEVLPHFFLEYVDKSDVSEDRWKDRVVYDGTWGEGNIYNFFFLVINKLYFSVNKSFEIEKDGITRRETNSVQIALREAFVNSIIHSDFKIDEPIKITRYKDYYEFKNPGSLRISKDDFFRGEHSKPRNSIINDIFKHINLCEQAGSGIPKILSAVKKEKFKYPEIQDENMSFSLKFWNVGNINNYEKASEEGKVILQYLLKEKKITNKEAREKFNYSKKKVILLFEELIDKGYMEKRGAGRGTYYRLKMTEDEERIEKILKERLGNDY